MWLSSKGEDPVKDETKVDENKRLLYALLFAEMNLDQAGFAAATRTTASQVSDYLKGKKTVSEAALERALDAVRFPRSLAPSALRAIRSFRAATRGWSRPDRVMTETFFADLLAVTGEAIEAIFAAATPAPPPRESVAPSSAAELWLRLERRNARQRVLLVEEIEEFQTPELRDLVAAKSIEAAPSNPEEAKELADLARRIGERSSLRLLSRPW
jgi:transcriptional regulator with XRE-family HTH domain